MTAILLERHGEVAALQHGDQRLLIGPWRAFTGVAPGLLIRDEMTLRATLGPYLHDDASRMALRRWLDRQPGGADGWRHGTDDTLQRLGGMVRAGAIAAVVLPASAGADTALPTRPAAVTLATPAAPVSQWSLEARFRYVLERLPHHLGPEARAALEAMLSPETVAMLVGVLVIWAGSHAFGVGFIADAALVGIGFALAGWAIFDALKHLADFFQLTVNATSEADLDAAARSLATAATQLGIGTLVALLTRGAGRLMKRPTRAAEPAPQQPASSTPRQSVNSAEAAAGARPATFGHATSNDYRRTFFDAHPELQDQVVVHHAVEQQVLRRYPGVVTEAEIHSLENLRGIPRELNADLHLSQIRREWNRFYRQTPNPTRQQLLDKATEIDRLFGSQFRPPLE